MISNGVSPNDNRTPIKTYNDIIEMLEILFVVDIVQTKAFSIFDNCLQASVFVIYFMPHITAFRWFSYLIFFQPKTTFE